jgi:hypothetical protein
MSPIPTFTPNDGHTIPRSGLGVLLATPSTPQRRAAANTDHGYDNARHNFDVEPATARWAERSGRSGQARAVRIGPDPGQFQAA